MNNSASLVRSPLLLSRDDSALVVVDAQEKLLAIIPERDSLQTNLLKLLQAAKVLNVPILATDQYPERLGSSPTQLAEHMPKPNGKRSFSCGGCQQFTVELSGLSVRQIVLVGIETHVCILQTAFGNLLTAGLTFLWWWTVGTERQIDSETAL
ncbi:MAG: isochorismatase family protein [Pirellulaceae bacterium]